MSSTYCVDCIIDTYCTTTGSSTAFDCQKCPCLSSTEGYTAQNSISSCICDKMYYKANETCTLCPKGALCPNNAFCALRNTDFLCTNGSKIVGNWTFSDVSGIIVLISCPAGYSLLSTSLTGSPDLQECQPCLSNQYILDPNNDQCQTCPPGLRCMGTSIVNPVTPNSTWVQHGSVYLLLGCPAGYSVSSAGVTGSFDATVQQCSPCPKGEECVSAPCVTCSPCKPGFYKPAVSADACAACPVDTYNMLTGAQDLSLCQRCQTYATTLGNIAQTCQSACVCDDQYYAVMTKTSSTCANCPTGATCVDRSCALRNLSSLSCPDFGRIVGDWRKENTSGYESIVLVSCPSGYSLRSTAVARSPDLQECQACLPTQYILNPDLDTCKTCPPGLICNGSDFAIPLLVNSTWIRNGSIYLLIDCPAGYSVSSTGVSGFDATVQQCSPCAKGQECVSVSVPCVTCSPCKPGFYKQAASSDACAPCPANTYNMLAGAQDLSLCQQCQTHATTQNLVAQGSLTSCVCDPQYYLFLHLSSATCVACPQGATCSDGSCALRNTSSLACPDGNSVVGSWNMNNITGLYQLSGCPAGYFLNSNQCQRCPSSFYCTGGQLPSTPCASTQFSLPGSRSITECYAAVFVVVVFNVPLPRPYFLSIQTTEFQNALARLAQVDAAFVTVDIIQAGSDSATTDVTCKIATLNAPEANALSNSFTENLGAVDTAFMSMGSDFKGTSLSSVEVTACVPGYELATQPPPSACKLCLPNYYCLGGANGRMPCPQLYSFSNAGANASIACTEFAVSILVSIPMSIGNFTAVAQLAFLRAVALAAQISLDRVSIILVAEGTSRRSTQMIRRAASPLLQVTSQISAGNTEDATALSSKIDSPTLNTNLVAVGLPQTTSLSANVKSSNSGSESQLPSQTVIAEASLGSLLFILLVSAAGYRLIVMIFRQRAYKAFVTAFINAKPLDAASVHTLPHGLKKKYIGEKVIGKGAFGCVVKAKKKESDQTVAIKIVLPTKGVFDDKELRRLKREASVHELFMSRKCEHAVHLAASVGSVEIQAKVGWMVLEFLDGEDMDSIVHAAAEDNVSDDKECIRVARGVLAALKVMHAEGIVHRDVKPSNIFRCWRKLEVDGPSAASASSIKLIDFGSAVGVDEIVAKEAMMTLVGNRAVAVGTPPYMSPEMFKEPDKASYPTDIWSLGVTMFELVTARLPFISDSELLWGFVVAGNMEEKASQVLDVLPESRRSTFDHNLSKVIAKALEKKVDNRYGSADEMHEAVYACLIERGEACYSVFISYRVASEAPLARLIFDELNHSVTLGGHRVTVYWDAHRLVKGEDWEEGFATGLLCSLCFLPLLSYGSTAPLASLPHEADKFKQSIDKGWEASPVGRTRLKGNISDPEDNVLKEFLIAAALLKTSKSCTEGKALLQVAYPLLVGRQQPPGHPDYPRMSNFFPLQGGGGCFPDKPSPATSSAVHGFLLNKAGFTEDTAEQVKQMSVQDAVAALTRLQGCQLWNHSKVSAYDLQSERILSTTSPKCILNPCG